MVTTASWTVPTDYGNRPRAGNEDTKKAQELTQMKKTQEEEKLHLQDELCPEILPFPARKSSDTSFFFHHHLGLQRIPSLSLSHDTIRHFVLWHSLFIFFYGIVISPICNGTKKLQQIKSYLTSQITDHCTGE